MTGRCGGHRRGRATRVTVVIMPLLATVAVLIGGCTRARTAEPTTSPPTTVTSTSIVGTSTSYRTVTTVLGTLTVPGSVTTVTHSPPPPTTIGPPPSTPEPERVPGTCPYLSDEAVMDANGQHTGQTFLIKTKPYPVCIFTRSSHTAGWYMAATRIVVAKTAAAAAAAVDQHVPIEHSSPAIYPQGWKGGAMGNLDGVGPYPWAHSIYAVSKGRIAVIAISNQKQSIKGRQMVEQIVTNLKL